MPTAVLVGVLLLCLLLLLLTIGEALPARCGGEPCAVLTVVPLCACETVHHLRLQMTQLDWADESLVGTVILLRLDADDAVVDYCTRLCARRDDVFLCTPAELNAVIAARTLSRS